MMRSREEVRTMLDKFIAARTDTDEENTAAQGIYDTLLWVLNDGSRDDWDLEQYLPEEDEDDNA